jgi:hypothetical protein
MITILEIAQKAYSAYSKTTDNKNFLGKEMHRFDDLPPQIKDAWCNACTATILIYEQRTSKEKIDLLGKTVTVPAEAIEHSPGSIVVDEIKEGDKIKIIASPSMLQDIGISRIIPGDTGIVSRISKERNFLEVDIDGGVGSGWQIQFDEWAKFLEKV